MGYLPNNMKTNIRQHTLQTIRPEEQGFIYSCTHSMDEPQVVFIETWQIIAAYCTYIESEMNLLMRVNVNENS